LHVNVQYQVAALPLGFVESAAVGTVKVGAKKLCMLEELAALDAALELLSGDVVVGLALLPRAAALPSGIGDGESQRPVDQEVSDQRRLAGAGGRGDDENNRHLEERGRR